MLVKALLVAAVCTVSVVCFEHGEISELSNDCSAQVDSLIDSYGDVPLRGTEANCSEVIIQALDDQEGTNCPLQGQLLGCFQAKAAEWQDLVSRCQLFSPAPNCIGVGGVPSRTGAACKRPVKNGYYLTMGPQVLQTTFYEFRTGIVPNSGAEWDQVPTQATVERRHRRALMAAEGEGSAAVAGGSGGCFPDFYTTADFTAWMQGSYQAPSTYSNNNISPIAIIFWILHGFGVLSLAWL
jgi:hypothetical protein